MDEKKLLSLESELLNYEPYGAIRRRLSPAEHESAQKIFGEAIDYEVVEIVPHNFFLFKDRPFAMRNRIHIPRAWYMDDFWDYEGDDNLVWYYRTIVIHELTHVWQYQTPELKYHWLKAFFEGLRYGDDVYKYDINEHSCLKDFRFEQQGQILQDYGHFVLRYNVRPGPYHRVIDCSIPQPSDLLAEDMTNCSKMIPYGNMVLGR